MTDLSLRPRSATELVDAAFQILRRDPVQFIVAAAVAYVPWLVLRLLFDPTVSSDNPDLLRATIGAALGVVVYSVAGGAITLLARDAYLDRKLDLAGAYRTVGRRLVPLIATSLITFALFLIGAVMLLFPALYPMARFFSVRQAVILETAGVGTALSRSSELSLGLKRHVLSTLLLALVVVAAISFGAGLFMSLLPSRVLIVVVSTALSVLVYPFLAITETLLYYDTRIRKEGFDVEYLAGRGLPLDPASGTAS